MSKPKTALESQERLYDRLLTTLPYESKAILIGVLDELRAAQLKHPKWPKDHIHCAAIVSEEAGELIRAALNKDFPEMKSEAFQTAAMGIRFLLDTKP